MRKQSSSIALTIILAFSLSFLLTGCLCKHEWTNATCTSAQKCIHCNITHGEPISHSWANATCQTPKTCTVCGATEGELLPHTWTGATCSQPQTCSICSVTEGDKLPHTPVEEWVTKSTSYVYAETVNVQACSGCGEIVNQEILDIDKLHDDTYFLISPEDFITRLGNKLASYTGNNYKTKGASTTDSYGCGVIENGEAVCVLLFNKNGDMITASQRGNSGAFNKLIGQCSADALARVSCGLMQATDPTLTLDDAKRYTEEMMRYDSVSVNGIKYVLTAYGSQYILGFTID